LNYPIDIANVRLIKKYSGKIKKTREKSRKLKKNTENDMETTLLSREDT
jgi:ribosomal protein L24